jgi:DNA-binding NarL/FixJ family response regulator
LLPAQPTPTPASDEVIDPRHVEIYTLCEQGLSTQQIADRLHRPSGEVELIIALRPRSHAMGSSRD